MKVRQVKFQVDIGDRGRSEVIAEDRFRPFLGPGSEFLNFNAYEPELKPLVLLFRKAQQNYKKMDRLEQEKSQIGRKRENVYNRTRTNSRQKKLPAGPSMVDVTSGQGAGNAGKDDSKDPTES